MTDLRTAAQQALKILELEGWGYPSPKTAEAITALKAALVEDAMQKFTDVNQELEAALAEPVQEPVAWIHTDPDKRRVKFLEWRENEPGYRGDWIKTPLYTAPPQRKPEPNSDYERGFVDGMSEQARRSVDKAVNAMIKCKPLAEEEIARLVTNDMVKFARAVERAHGIGGQP